MPGCCPQVPRPKCREPLPPPMIPPPYCAAYPPSSLCATSSSFDFAIVCTGNGRSLWMGAGDLPSVERLGTGPCCQHPCTAPPPLLRPSCHLPPIPEHHTQYVAPEILAQGIVSSAAGYGSAVDMWSAGVMLFECLCGTPPFFSRRDLPPLPAQIWFVQMGLVSCCTAYGPLKCGLCKWGWSVCCLAHVCEWLAEGGCSHAVCSRLRVVGPCTGTHDCACVHHCDV